ncbi:MAG: molybdenum cofactor biosynthesis protein MoaE [Desulfotignum sp.]|jgi:molybdopterin synthase catalytic subunit|nr:molybdenum cofactor biosynthesis protein MoaE [Desulfotignum sp.]
MNESNAHTDTVTLEQMIRKIKGHPDFSRAGMILAHNGIVRATSRDGRPVTGLEIAVDHGKLKQILQKERSRPGILDIQVHIRENTKLTVGDDVMFLVVAGDIRENVIQTLTDTLNQIKSQVTSKTQFFQ